MSYRNLFSSFAVTAVVAGATQMTPSVGLADDQKKPDNSAVNKRDRAEGAATADSQKMNKPDREVTQQIRKAIMDDKSLSTYAHNVKIVTRNGMVTLKGPVRSEEEKQTIMKMATDAAGASNVKDEMQVSPKNK